MVRKEGVLKPMRAQAKQGARWRVKTVRNDFEQLEDRPEGFSTRDGKTKTKCTWEYIQGLGAAGQRSYGERSSFKIVSKKTNFLWAI